MNEVHLLGQRQILPLFCCRSVQGCMTCKLSYLPHTQSRDMYVLYLPTSFRCDA